MIDADHIRKGIAAYQHEQAVILRLLRKRGVFTSSEFDTWLMGREWRRPKLRATGISGDSFILGDMSGSMCSKWLNLLQWMMQLDLVDARSLEGVVIYYEVKHD